MTGLVKRSFALAGHRTSVALEHEFWAVLERIAAARGLRLSGLVAAVDAGREPGRPLASALRVLALKGEEREVRWIEGRHGPTTPAGSAR